MNTLKIKIENFLSKYCIYIFAIITLLIFLSHTPFWDETHAFEIARLKLSQIFYLTRIEGHPILWYLILKPFSSLKLYPYSMQIINWLFCIGAIYVLWKKAPFSPINKALITFSTPFLFYFGPIARNYAIGILFLFLICAYHKKRFKKPILYSILIALAANTSIMVMVGVFYIGLLFLYDLTLKIKRKAFSKKNFYLVVSIFLLCTFLVLAQFIGVREMGHSLIEEVWSNLSRFALFPRGISFLPLLTHIITSVAFYYYGFLAFKNTKRGFFFISMTYISLTLIFLFVYYGCHWHYYFFFVYFLVFLWIYGKKILINKFSKILLTILLVLFIFPMAVIETGEMGLIYTSKSKQIANQIINNKYLKNSKLYNLNWWSDLSPGASMYLEKENIHIYDLHNRKRTSFESLKDIFYLEFEPIDFDEFYSKIDKNGYLLEMESLTNRQYKNTKIYSRNNDFIFQTEKNTYLIKQLGENQKTNLKVYKIIKI